MDDHPHLIHLLLSIAGGGGAEGEGSLVAAAATMQPPSPSSPTTTSKQQQDHINLPTEDEAEEEEEEPTCRVCHMEAEEDDGRPLYHPCLCRGSIKYVHQDCLLQWLEASRNSTKRCELCSSQFIFAPVYASGRVYRGSMLIQ